MRVFTIGFTKTTAQGFFERLRDSGARSLVDVRLNNVSQLAGFAKRDDLDYFTREICKIPYRHCTSLAPTQPMLDDYRKRRDDWPEYAHRFLALMRARRIEEMDRKLLDGACLLCSEATPHQCHRRLVAEYLRQRWRDVEITHL
jgi:uncharacterized protein (DUF488 family)